MPSYVFAGFDRATFLTAWLVTTTVQSVKTADVNSTWSLYYVRFTFVHFCLWREGLDQPQGVVVTSHALGETKKRLLFQNANIQPTAV